MSGKFTHGGARPGSGRRKLGKVSLVIRLTPWNRQRIKTRAEYLGVSQSKMMEIILNSYFENGD